jgi:hypothetical protein
VVLVVAWIENHEQVKQKANDRVDYGRWQREHMSWLSAEEPEARTPPPCKALESVIVPRPRDIGGFEVRRVLPSAERRSVGPFVFFDQMGAAELPPGSGIVIVGRRHQFARLRRDPRAQGQAHLSARAQRRRRRLHSYGGDHRSRLSA